MRWIFLLLGCMAAIVAEAQKNDETDLKSLWQKNVESAQEIVAIYRAGKTNIDTIANNCFLILKSGDYILRHRGNREDIAWLVQQMPTVDLEVPAVQQFLQQLTTLNDTTLMPCLKRDRPKMWTDVYFMMSAMKKGDSFDEARDGLEATTFLPVKGINQHDYRKLQTFFSLQVPLLHEIYLEKMKFLFQHNGSTEEMLELKPLIQKQVKASKVKEEILALYAQYETLRSGIPAPLSSLKDREGKSYTFRDWKGKVIVVDVWATWCCACIEKMPAFIQLRNEFADRKKVVFLTVSIDQPRAHAKWLQALQKNQMTDLLNLIVDAKGASSFVADYHVVGVPRYIIIDRKGKIVNAFAPAPGEEMKDWIQKAWKK